MTAAAATGLIVLPNQLFDLAHVRHETITHVFMSEDRAFFTEFKFHQQKIIFMLAAMRAHAEVWRRAGVHVTYAAVTETHQSLTKDIQAWIEACQLKRVVCFEIEDKPVAEEVVRAVAGAGTTLDVITTPMFLTTRGQFSNYLQPKRRPFMKTFYEQQRRRLQILMAADQRPVGGRWSYDEENRQAWPKGHTPPAPPRAPRCVHSERAQQDCAALFGDHPGDSTPLWLPATRAGAKRWLKTFLIERFAQFGPYEDALSAEHDVLYHSVLTPYLNNGLLTPHEVIEAALAHAQAHAIPLNSLEGFVRQVIGWREFVRGIYQNFSEHQEQQNFFRHTRELSSSWYTAETGIVPLDGVIKKVKRLGYAHHIERLMVVGSLMLLLEVAPEAGHRWFMEMFIDSARWVMGPNVYGMALFSDGGLFATKPYICGANYYKKMGYTTQGAWVDAVDGLYWRFIDKHRGYFSRNPRSLMAVRAVDRLDPERQARIFSAAEELQARITRPSAQP